MPNKKKSLPGPIPILMIVIILAAICTWILPAGEYAKLSTDGNSFLVTNNIGNTTLPLSQKTLDSLGIQIKIEKFIIGDIRKPVSIPGTYTPLKRNPQGFVAILEAPIKGIYDSIDIILFTLIIGGFMYVFNETGAMTKGISWLGHSMKGREPLLIGILTAIFSFLAGSYGMGEEALVFYPILVPLFVSAGYDLLVPFAIIFGGTSIGTVSGFTNPFQVVIASNSSGINWMDGLVERLILWAVLTAILIAYILRYASKIKKDPTASLVLKYDGTVVPPYNIQLNETVETPTLNLKTKLLLFIYIATFLSMIGGVVFLDWWMKEMSALFLGSSILIAIIGRINEKTFIKEFIKGAENLLAVAFIIGVARGVTIVLNEGHISDSILFYAAHLVSGMNPVIFILFILLFYMIFSIFIQSSSGMAVLTMPIIGALAILVNIPGREIVNAYMSGMSIMSFLVPTGLVLPSLAMVNISLKTWFKFIMPLLIIITILCALELIIGINI